MKCSKCGTENQEGNMFCVSCGARLKVESKIENNNIDNGVNGNPQNKGIKGLLITLIILVVIAIGIGVYFIIKSLSKDNSGGSGNDPTPTPVVTITPSPSQVPTPEPIITPTPEPAPLVNKVTCSGSYKEDGVGEMGAEIIVEFDDNNIIKNASIIYDLKDIPNATSYCQVFKMMEDPTKGIEVNCSGSKIEITNVDKMEDDEDFDLAGVSKDELIEAMKSEGFTCR